MSELKLPRWTPNYEDMIKNIDLMDGYESPIKKMVQNVADDITQKENEYLVECVHRVGFDIDEKELKKALEYDRNEYAKGVEYGIKLGRQQVANQFVDIMYKVYDDLGLSLSDILKSKGLNNS